MGQGAPLEPELPTFHDMGDGRLSVHGTAVALDDRGLLILGPAGSGKSGLAAGMIALGAALVVDDLVILSDDTAAGSLRVAAPPGRPLRLELRGLGLVEPPTAGPVPLVALLLLAPSAARLPEPASLTLFGRAVPLLRHPAHPDLAAKMMLWLGASRLRDPGAEPLPGAAAEHRSKRSSQKGRP
ncbi:HPr kinase/phosphorylase [Jannaschia ovalis]|uniref:Serine kinase n=1 Tax=Jannaschia ovalis TaxID=3038773 RepID=A0ABY8LFS7_9RHOB|nr:serine kinase [Jannaschia sp. GRR-S6-38]WGH79200.1 serine kinase [Jannaschia sp. GRR-S6-38]